MAVVLAALGVISIAYGLLMAVLYPISSGPQLMFAGASPVSGS